MSRQWAELHRQVCFGESGGRIIWQPRIGCWYSDKRFEQESFPPPFTGMSWAEIYREYERYVEPSYHRRCEKLHGAGKFVSAHWDGDVNALLPYVQRSQLDAIEAVTPVPQGDADLECVKEAFGDRVFMMDGIPAIYFDDTFSVSVLEDCVQRIIDLFAPRLILGISDEISSTGDIERVRLVRDWVDAFNASR